MNFIYYIIYIIFISIRYRGEERRRYQVIIILCGRNLVTLLSDIEGDPISVHLFYSFILSLLLFSWL